MGEPCGFMSVSNGLAQPHGSPSYMEMVAIVIRVLLSIPPHTAMCACEARQPRLERRIEEGPAVMRDSSLVLEDWRRWHRQGSGGTCSRGSQYSSPAQSRRMREPVAVMRGRRGGCLSCNCCFQFGGLRRGATTGSAELVIRRNFSAYPPSCISAAASRQQLPGHEVQTPDWIRYRGGAVQL